jgi:hypothetical protein
VFLQGAVLALFGVLFLLSGTGLAVFRLTVSRGHRRGMEMVAGRRCREAADAMTSGTWLSVGVISGLPGAGLLFAGLNLRVRHRQFDDSGAPASDSRR